MLEMLFPACRIDDISGIQPASAQSAYGIIGANLDLKMVGRVKRANPKSPD